MAGRWTIASVTNRRPVETVESCCSCCPWQAWAGAIFLTRSGAGNVPLVFGDPDTPKGSEVFGTDDLNFGFGWGPSVGVTYCLSSCNRIGVEFYAIDGWAATGQVSGNYSVQFPSLPYLPELGTPGDPTSGYGTATFRYTSNLYNTEINFYHRSENVCWLTTLAGFRWMEISEEFSTVFADGCEPHRTIAIDVNNHLYGVQFGALVGLQNWGPWYLDGWLKAGVYGAAANQSTTEDFTSAGGVVTFADRPTTQMWRSPAILVCRLHVGLRIGYPSELATRCSGSRESPWHQSNWTTPTPPTRSPSWTVAEVRFTTVVSSAASTFGSRTASTQ